MTISAFGSYVNAGGQIVDKGSISYTKYNNVDSDLIREFGAAAKTNPFITGCTRCGAGATGHYVYNTDVENTSTFDSYF